MTSIIAPSFMIIGERKCGTTSLYRYLLDHPQVLPCKVKETNFFAHSTRHVRRNAHAYLGFFPSRSDAEATSEVLELDDDDRIVKTTLRKPIVPGVEYITGEASANVLSTVPPRRLRSVLPELKLIVVARHPVDRAFSHHAMHARFRAEGRRLFGWVSDYRRDFARERALARVGVRGPYLAPGRYVENLRRWERTFPREQMFFVRTEDLEKVGVTVMNELTAFLGLAPHDYADVLSKRFNVASTTPRDEQTARELATYFAPYTRELEAHLGRDLDWSTTTLG